MTERDASEPMCIKVYYGDDLPPFARVDGTDFARGEDETPDTFERRMYRIAVERRVSHFVIGGFAFREACDE